MPTHYPNPNQPLTAMDPKEADVSDLKNLAPGDELDGRAIIYIDVLNIVEAHYAPLAVVTRVWRSTENTDREYVTHLLNMQAGGFSHGEYTTDRRTALDNHEEKIRQWAPTELPEREAGATLSKEDAIKAADALQYLSDIQEYGLEEDEQSSLDEKAEAARRLVSLLRDQI